MNFKQPHTVEEIAGVVGGEVVGDGRRELRGVADFASACDGDLVILADRRLQAAARSSQAGCLLLGAGIDLHKRTAIRVESPMLAFAQVVKAYMPREGAPIGMHPTAVCGEGVHLGEGVALGAHVAIGNGVRLDDRVIVYPGVCIGDDVVAGEDTIIHARVSIRARTRIGARVVIHDGAVIGSDGFRYDLSGDLPRKIPQIGDVVIEDDVEIGANTTIDRAMLGSTIIRRGAKLDNLVQVGHNAEIGEGSVLAAFAGISGSTTLGRKVVMGGQVGVIDHLSIGDGARIGAKTGIFSNLRPNQDYMGIPARPLWRQLRINVAVAKLPDLLRRVKALEKAVRDGDRKS